MLIRGLLLLINKHTNTRLIQLPGCSHIFRHFRRPQRRYFAGGVGKNKCDREGIKPTIFHFPAKAWILCIPAEKTGSVLHVLPAGLFGMNICVIQKGGNAGMIDIQIIACDALLPGKFQAIRNLLKFELLLHRFYNGT